MGWVQNGKRLLGLRATKMRTGVCKSYFWIDFFHNYQRLSTLSNLNASLQQYLWNLDSQQINLCVCVVIKKFELHFCSYKILCVRACGVCDDLCLNYASLQLIVVRVCVLYLIFALHLAIKCVCVCGSCKTFWISFATICLCVFLLQFAFDLHLATINVCGNVCYN